MRTIIAEVLRETLDMREGRDLMLDTGTRKKQDQGHKNGNLDQTFRAEELNTHSPGEHQDDRGWSYSKKNTSLEQTTAEALQILKKNETQSLATGGRSAGDPNKLNITFYGNTSGFNYVNGTSALEFVSSLKIWGTNIQTVLRDTHSEEEIDKVRIKGLLGSLEEARALVARNTKSGLGHSKLDIQKLLIDVPTVLGKPPVTAGTWEDVVQTIEEAYFTLSNKKDLLSDFEKLKQTDTIRHYSNEFASKLSALLSADANTKYKNEECVVEAFLTGLSESWRKEQYRGDSSVRTLADIYKKLQPVMAHEDSGKPIAQETKMNSAHSRGPAAIQSRLGPVQQQRQPGQFNTFHVMAFRRLGGRCGRCGGPHRQWNDSDDPTVVICPPTSKPRQERPGGLGGPTTQRHRPSSWSGPL